MTVSVEESEGVRDREEGVEEGEEGEGVDDRTNEVVKSATMAAIVDGGAGLATGLVLTGMVTEGVGHSTPTLRN